MVVNPFEKIKSEYVKNGQNTSTPLRKENDVSTWGIEIKKEIEIKENNDPKIKIAMSEGYEATTNPNVYFDKNKNIYYLWNNEKQKFEKQKKYKNILKTGYIETKDGSFLDKNGELFIKKEKTYYWPKKDIGYHLPYEMAKVQGLDRTYKEFLFYDKETKEYKVWNEKEQKFVKSKITAVTKDQYYQIGDKYFDYWGKPVSEKDFTASKNYYIKTNTPDVFIDGNNTEKYYKWNEDKNKFEEYGPNAEMNKLLNQKSDGKLDDLKQGNIGDCWLISSAVAVYSKNPELFREILKVDENGNTTVNLKGVNKTYKFTTKEIDDAIKTQNYSTGDRDMIAIELAFENFRKDCFKENKNNKRNRLGLYNMADESYYLAEGSYLEGGTPRNAIEVLTGKKVTSLTKTANSNIYYENNVAKLGKLDEQHLKKYFDDSNKLIIASIDTSKDEYHKESHGVIFKSYDENYVYLIDPNDTSKTIKKTKKEFYDKLLRIDYTSLKEPIDEKISNSKYLNVIDSEEVKKYKTDKNN